MESKKLFYSVQEATELVGVSSDKIYELVRAAQIPHKRLGRRILIPVAAFHDWAAKPDPWENSGG